MSNLDRRTFLQTSAFAGAGLVTGSTSPAVDKKIKTQPSTNPKSKINLGIIGVGLRGQSHIDLALNRTDCEVVAICDVDETMIQRTLSLFDKKGKPKPKIFLGDQSYLQLLAESNIDAVIIASPWQYHTEQAVAAMRAGKYVGTEVWGAFSLEECWQLVNAYEATGVPLFFLENVCYRRDVMAILNMVRQNMFGELIHLECGYQHDLRAVKFNDGKQPYGNGVEFGEKGFSEAKWRTVHSVFRNGDLYPTHGIGPVAQLININRGNRLIQLTSTASKARGLHEYIINHPAGGRNHPNAKVEFKLGDKITTVVQTYLGESIIIHHDTNLPRPYSLGFRVQGTKGLWMDINNSIHLEGVSPNHEWETANKYLQTYDHPLWKKYEQLATGAGHGGMDYFLLNAFVESAKEGAQAPIDVYDAATWLAITTLSEQSIALGSQPVTFPDFTRGRWMTNKVAFALGDKY